MPGYDTVETTDPATDWVPDQSPDLAPDRSPDPATDQSPDRSPDQVTNCQLPDAQVPRRGDQHVQGVPILQYWGVPFQLPRRPCRFMRGLCDSDFQRAPHDVGKDTQRQRILRLVL